MAETNEAQVATKEDEKKTIIWAITEGRNPRGIPMARFIENVESFLQDPLVGSLEAAMGALNELYSKYKYMEKSFEKSKAVYKSKIPEITQTLEMIEAMKRKKDAASEGEGDANMVVNYSLCDTIYARANVDTEVGKVCLWIGASTMVEYTYEEAIELLQHQKADTIAKVEELNEDLFHLRGNSITVEVNMARLFNHRVKMKKIKEAAEASKV